MNSPLVSFIIISYNHAPYIGQTLDSILGQTYQNFELILADDASKDNSAEVFDSWLLRNNRTAIKNYHEKNTGMAAMLNECVDLCHGEYVKILAADDYLDSQYLEKCVSKLEQLGSEYGMVATNIHRVKDDGEIVEYVDYNKFWEGLTSEDFRLSIRKGNKIAAPSVMMRTQALRETGPYDESIIIEDFDRWLRINEKYLITYIPEKLVYYRWHEGSISALKWTQIRAEGLMLKMKFDHDGMASGTINSRVRNFYLDIDDIPKKLLEKYNAYPYKEKLLNLFMQNNLPRKFYLLIRKMK